MMTAPDDIIIDDDDWEDDDDPSGGGDGGGTISGTSYETVIDYSPGYSAPCSSSTNSFIQVKSGAINFGNRNPSTGTLNTVFTIKAYTSGGYYGIACNASKIDITGGPGLYSMNKSNEVILKAGSYYGASGKLVVITDLKLVVGEGINWTIEKLPFIDGVCVAER